MRSACLLPVLVLALAAACKVYDPLYCDAHRDCDDPARPFCDVAGSYPASEGIKRTCIAEPMQVTPMADFTIEVEAATVPVRVDGEATVEVTIARRDGFSEEIELRAEGLPPGVTAASTTVSSDVDKATVTIAGNELAIGSKTTVIIVAKASELERTGEFELLVLGTPGSLDPTFGLLGVAAEPSNGTLGTDDATQLLSFSDGSFVVGGNASANGLATLVRFKADGSPDDGFGPMATRNFNGDRIGLSARIPYRFVQQSSGMIVVAVAAAEADYAVGRLAADGEFDGSFRDGGLFRANTLSEVTISRLAVGPVDEVVVPMTVGQSRDRIWINRFTADGTFDSTFAGGRAEIDLGDYHQLESLRVLRDGSLLGTATASVDGVNRSSVFRLTPQGAFDEDFAEGGVLELPAGEVAHAGIDLADGGILLAGEVTLEGVRTPRLWRMDGRGTLEPGFGDGGRASMPLPGKRSGSVKLLVPLDDVRVLAVGAPGITVMMVRLADGALDPTFGTDGMSITAFQETIAPVSAVLLPDGRFAVLADEDSFDFALARFFL